MALHESGGPPSTLTRPTDHARSVLKLVESVLACLAVVVAVSVGVGAALTRPATDNDPQLTGLFVAVAVLAVCWALLGIAVACGSRHLGATERERWSNEWARVEPIWTGRPQRTSGPETTDPSITG